MARLVSATVSTSETSLVVTCSLDTEEGLLVPIQMTLLGHDDVAVNFFANGACSKIGSSWELRVSLESGDRRRIVQIAKIVDGSGQDIAISEPLIFLKPESGNEWHAGDRARRELSEIEAARRQRYAVTLQADDAKATDQIFSSVILADDLLITSQLRIPGISVLKLTDSTLGSDGASVLNSVLGQLGFTAFVSSEAWLSEMRNRRPAVVLHMPSVQAPDAGTAAMASRKAAHQLLDLLALNRGSRGRIIGGVIGTPTSAPSGGMKFSGSWIEGGGYQGNLLGGFIAGEDPHSLLSQWDAVSQDPRLRLWLSLYSDAIMDERWEYQLFRCFNLLEGIGKEKLPSNAAIVGSDGIPKLMANGQKYTTKQAQGKVFELLRLIASMTNQAESNFALRGTGGSGDLWDEIGVWTAVRNSVAHRGSWSLPEGKTPDAKHAQIEQGIKARGHDQTMASGVDALVRSIRNAAEATISAGLRKLI
ncbi:hypothetical protein ACIP93_05250 [Streptomyces sp. NPDC088745]|uniref:hypothetical protein n=1 Tax=Streptomyces sp. NPDC088745 TaxID=3365884 RepID=UPI003823DDFD